MRYVTILTQNKAIGAATASGGGRAPIASFWVGVMLSCIYIKRGVLNAELIFFHACRQTQEEGRPLQDGLQSFPRARGHLHLVLTLFTVHTDVGLGIIFYCHILLRNCSYCVLFLNSAKEIQTVNGLMFQPKQSLS